MADTIPFYDLPVGAEFRREGREAIWRKEDSDLAFLPDAPRPGGKPVFLLVHWDADVEPLAAGAPRAMNLEAQMALARIADAILLNRKLIPRRKREDEEDAG